MSDISASEFLSRQDELEQEARELMPWDPKTCTYEMGPLKQSVFACRTHHNIGLCYSCSIQCHTQCDIVELFTKRQFTCDCGTERDHQDPGEGYRCQLRQNREPDVPSLTNTYGQNYEGLFCECHKEYDPDSNATMIQCALGTECNEDWYHDSCIGGKIPPIESFDAYICWKCAKKYDYYFKRILAHPLGDQIITNTLAHSVKQENNDGSGLKSGQKRTADEMDPGSHNDGEYSIFLKEGFSEKLGELKNSIKDHDNKLYLFLNDLVPFLIENEPVYEPTDDAEEAPDDLVSNVLRNAMHREEAIAGISAFNTLKLKLNEFLKPFAETGNVVKEEDIKSFFQRPEETSK